MYPLITLTTDFGVSDAYVASMKGVILSINPAVTIVDICHTIEPQNVAQAAFILSNACPYFPEGTVHVAIVDPGVGSQRKAIILKTPSALFVAPDNGVLSYIVNEFYPKDTGTPPSTPPNLEEGEIGADVEAITITNPRFWQQPVSATFHGRDVFAPVAAHLSLGVPHHKFGESTSSVCIFPTARPCFDTKGILIGHIIHIDHFGNLITNVRSSDLSEGANTIEVAQQYIHGLSHFYAQKKGLAAIIGSSGYLEVSLENGNAASFLNARVGDEIKVRLTDGK